MEGGGRIGHTITSRLPSICVENHVDVDYPRLPWLWFGIWLSTPGLQSLPSMWVNYHVQMVQGVGEGCFSRK